MIENLQRLPEKKQARIFGMLKVLTFIQIGETSDTLDFISGIDQNQVKKPGRTNGGRSHGTLNSPEAAAIN